MEYCICHGPEDGTVMIACSRKRSRCKGDSVRPQSADREWYHLQCVGLAEEPRGEWLCPACVAYAEEQALATQRRRDATKVATEVAKQRALERQRQREAAKVAAMEQSLERQRQRDAVKLAAKATKAAAQEAAAADKKTKRVVGRWLSLVKRARARWWCIRLSSAATRYSFRGTELSGQMWEKDVYMVVARLVDSATKQFDTYVRTECRKKLTELIRVASLDPKKVAEQAARKAATDKKERDLAMLIANTGVSEAVARCAMGGQIGTALLHDSDAGAWTGVSFSSQNAEAVLEQLRQQQQDHEQMCAPKPIDPIRFVAAVADRIVSATFSDSFLNESLLGRDNLEWLATQLAPAPGAVQMTATQRLDCRYGELLRYCLMSYQKLVQSVNVVPSGHAANAFYEYLHGRWLVSGAAAAWLEAVPECERRHCLGRDWRWSAFLLLEEQAHRVYLEMGFDTEAELTWTIPCGAEAQLRSLPEAAHENLVYVIGWAFSKTAQKVASRARTAGATNEEQLLSAAIQLARYDAALPAEYRRMPAALGKIEAKEYFDGALWRPTQQAYEFGLRVELLCRSWLTFSRIIRIRWCDGPRSTSIFIPERNVSGVGGLKLSDAESWFKRSATSSSATRCPSMNSDTMYSASTLISYSGMHGDHATDLFMRFTSASGIVAEDTHCT